MVDNRYEGNLRTTRWRSLLGTGEQTSPSPTRLGDIEGRLAVQGVAAEGLMLGLPGHHDQRRTGPALLRGFA
jgi:hypothetical protein